MVYPVYIIVNIYRKVMPFNLVTPHTIELLSCPNLGLFYSHTHTHTQTENNTETLINKFMFNA